MKIFAFFVPIETGCPRSPPLLRLGAALLRLKRPLLNGRDKHDR